MLCFLARNEGSSCADRWRPMHAAAGGDGEQGF